MLPSHARLKWFIKCRPYAEAEIACWFHTVSALVSIVDTTEMHLGIISINSRWLFFHLWYSLQVQSLCVGPITQKETSMLQNITKSVELSVCDACSYCEEICVDSGPIDIAARSFRRTHLRSETIGYRTVVLGLRFLQWEVDEFWSRYFGIWK